MYTPPTKISRKQAKPIIDRTFPNYKGHKVSVKFTETVVLGDLNWDGGTRSQYAGLKSDGQSELFSALNRLAPWNNPFEGKTITLAPDVLIVEHVFFCGKDCGLTIYAHPSNAPKLLTA